MRNIDEDTITQVVIARHAQAADARLRDVMTSLVQHLHAFAREVQLTEPEWRAGIRFLTETGQACNDRRQEFALLSDTLGLSMLVTALNHRPARGCTESTVPLPIAFDGSAAFARGDGTARGAPGRALLRARPCAGVGRRAGAQRRTAGGAGVCLALGYTLASTQIYAWVGVVFAAVMLGGLGRALAPLLAGVVIGVSEAVTMAVTAPSWAPLLSFALLIGILLLRPGRAS